MSVITVSITKAPENTVNTHTTMTFANQGGTMGRGVDNMWVLDDVERFISGVHARISCIGGRYFLSDLSTNGTFFNASLEPIGKGNKVPLSDGDTFALGEYEFYVTILDSADTVHDQLFANPSIDRVAGPFSDLSLTPAQSVDSLAHIPKQADLLWPHSVTDNPLDEVEYLFAHAPQQRDPLILLKGDQPSPSGAELGWISRASYSDGADAVSQSLLFPNVIPEDWDDDLSPLAVSNKTQINPDFSSESIDADKLYVCELERRIKEQEGRNRVLELQIQQLEEHSVASAGEGVGAGNGALIRSLGLEKYNLSEEKMAEISVVAGEFIRATIFGMMQALSHKNSIKNEFRMNVTTIQPVENNPLNFSANIEDAINSMFIKHGNAYKKPVDSIREGFQSITDHQVAVLAGIRAGFNGGIERFSPATLENRFNKYIKTSLIQVGKRAKHWDSYKDYYSELVDDMDISFRDLFGDDFVSAYEGQLQKLTLNRKNDGK